MAENISDFVFIITLTEQSIIMNYVFDDISIHLACWIMILLIQRIGQLAGPVYM